MPKVEFVSDLHQVTIGVESLSISAESRARYPPSANHIPAAPTQCDPQFSTKVNRSKNFFLCY